MNAEDREWRRRDAAEHSHIGPVHGPPRERGPGWERIRDELVRALTDEPLNRDRIAGLAETLDVLLTPGDFEAIEESRAEHDAGLALDGPTALAELRASLREADEHIAFGDLGTPLADVMAELEAEEAAAERGRFAQFWHDLRTAVLRTSPGFDPSRSTSRNRRKDQK